MSSGPIEELAVPYDPAPAEEKVRRRHRMFRSRIFSLGITVVVLIALYFFVGRKYNGIAIFGLYGLMLLVSVGWLVAAYLAYRMAKRELASVGQGTALVIDRSGVQLAGTRVPWAQVTALTAIKGPMFGSPLFQLAHAGGEVAVPFDHLEVSPARLDMVARAYSGGRHGVDLTAMDN